MKLVSEITRKTPKTIRKAWDATEKVIYKEDADRRDLNLSSILTHLIQQTGRFAEYYASDLFISWPRIETLCNDRDVKIDVPVDEIICFGIRQMGVDHNAYIISRLNDTTRGPLSPYVHADQVYRKILAVRVRISDKLDRGYTDPQPKVIVEYKDLSNAFHTIEDEDRKSD